MNIDMIRITDDGWARIMLGARMRECVDVWTIVLMGECTCNNGWEKVLVGGWESADGCKRVMCDDDKTSGRFKVISTSQRMSNYKLNQITSYH